MEKKENKKNKNSLISIIKSYLSTAFGDLFDFFKNLRTPETRKEMLKNFWDGILRFVQLFNSERISREAGSLTYITLLGFIPFLVFILMLIPDLPFLNLKEKIFLLISDNFMPTSAMTVNGVIENMLIRRAGFNVFSFVILMVSSYSLFRVIRNTFDRILKMEYHIKIDILSQLIRFLGTIILGVLIMIVMFSSASLPLVTRFLKLPYLQWMVYVFPFLMQFVGLICLYMLLPSIKVRRIYLIRGAFWTTLLWVIAKSAFDFYIYRLTNLQAMYGVVAALPIFLLWIYVNWIIILSGIVLVSTLENKTHLSADANEPKKMVRLTLEMYSNSRLNRKLEKLLSREDIKDLGSTLGEDPE